MCKSGVGCFSTLMGPPGQTLPKKWRVGTGCQGGWGLGGRGPSLNAAPNWRKNGPCIALHAVRRR